MSYPTPETGAVHTDQRTGDGRSSAASDAGNTLTTEDTVLLPGKEAKMAWRLPDPIDLIDLVNWLQLKGEIRTGSLVRATQSKGKITLTIRSEDNHFESVYTLDPAKIKEAAR